MPSPPLPQPPDEHAFDALDRRDPVFIEAVRDVFGAHTQGEHLAPTAVGSHVVLEVGDARIAKLFAPIHRAHFEAEQLALRILDGSDVPAPRLVATAEVGGWSALLMTRVPGRSLRALWPELEAPERQRLCRELGDVTARLHRLDPAPMGAVAVPWDAFLAGQREACAQTQAQRGLEADLVAQIPAFLASVQLEDAPHVLLHTELMLDHVFADAVDGAPHVTGLIDFEPAMIGLAEYELGSVGLFVAQGDPALLRAFLDGYGKAPDLELPRRIMALTLLHRYSRLSWYRRFMPAGDTLEELAARWFGGAP